MKHRTAFTVTLTTDKPVRATTLASVMRLVLKGLKVWQGEPAGRQAANVTKVTVTNIGEK
jgi:hypothetical protein